MALKRYFGRIDIDISEQNSTDSKLLENKDSLRIGQSNFSVYVPIDVNHTLFDDSSLRKACNLYEYNSIQEKSNILLLNLSKSPYLVKLSISLQSKKDQTISKKMQIYAVKRNLTQNNTDDILNAITKVKSWKLDNEEYELQQIFEPKEKIKRVLKGGKREKEKKVLSEAVSKNCLLELPQEVLIDKIETIQNTSEVSHYKHIQEQDAKTILENMLDLKDKLIIPFTPLSKNDNSEQAKIIRQLKKIVSSLELIKQVTENKIDLSKLDPATRQIYQSMEKDVDTWKNNDIRYLETIILQNQILLSNIEEMKKEFQEKLNDLKLQNEELLDINHYLVETTERAEQERKLALERKLKRQKAKKLAKRDYITSDDFF